MTSNNASQTFSHFDYSTLSPETLKNFDDFKNMFKGIDSDYFTPCDIAITVLEKIRHMGNQVRIDDAVEWFDNQLYFEIRDTVDERKLAYVHEHRLSPTNRFSGSDSDSDDWDNNEVSDIED